MKVFFSMTLVFVVTMVSILVLALDSMSEDLAAVIEAVMIIEDAAWNIEQDMLILNNIAARDQCYADRGEWSDEYGCHLEEVQ